MHERFLRRMAKAYPKIYREGPDPCAIPIDPYAIYGYEAMRLALEALNDTRNGTRREIRDQLFSSKTRDDSALGPYSINSDGDTNLPGYDIARIRDGRLTCPTRAVKPAQLATVMKELEELASKRIVRIVPE